MGYDHGPPVQDIAHRAGVGLATLYRRWPTKQALLAEALRQRNYCFERDIEGYLLGRAGRHLLAGGQIDGAQGGVPPRPPHRYSVS